MKPKYVIQRKRKVFYLIPVVIIIAAFLINQVNYFSGSDREKYEQFLSDHEYSQRNGLSSEELKQIPKADRPDLAWEQNFLMTMDPALGYPPKDRLKPVYKHVQELMKLKSGIPGDGTYDWVERGPNNVAGRVRALMFDPNDATAKKVWAGGVSGGLWFNNDITDANSTWNSVDDFWANLAISSIAYDPSNTQIFYVGTGEDWAGDVRGAGIWKTTDGGANWAQISSTDDNTNFNSTQKIVVTSSGRVLAGTNTELYVSDDGGATWTSTESGFVSDIEIDSNGNIYMAKGKGSQTGAILKSTDNGDNWTDITPGSSQNRVEIAIAPSNADVIYAVAAQGSNVGWFKKSIDAGATWTDITMPMYMTQSCEASTTDDFTRGQAWYDLILAISPTDPDLVLVGGIDVNKTTDGGTIWKTISYWTGACASYSHADQHAIMFRPGFPNEAIFGSDGGVSYSNDVGSSADPSFTIMNNDFNVTQFYSGAMHPDIRKNYFLAGAQDNGSQQFKSEGVNSTTEVTGGDGAFCFIDQTNPDIQITSYTNDNYYISRDGGNSFSDLFDGKGEGRFINPSDYDDNLHILYTAKNSTSINKITNVNTNPEVGLVPMTSLGGTASHIRVSPYTTTSSTLFVGTGSGRVFKVTDADNSSYSVTEITGSLPTAYVSCIEIGANEDELLVTFSNYGVSSVWYTNDGGANWSEKEGDLPDMPVRWALFNPNDRTQVILATEVGIWSTSDLTVASPVWTASNSALANVRVDMLQIRESDNMVMASTYGRGVFTSDGFSDIDASVLGAYFSIDGSANIFPGGTIKFEDLSTGTPTTWAWTFEGGTPASSTDQNPTVTYDTSGIYSVSLTIGDGAGSETTTRTDYINVAESGGWTVQATGFVDASRGIDFISVVNSNVVWAKAYDGANTDNKIKEFTKTIDGGQNWTPQTIDISGDIYPAMIHAINADTAWIPMYPNSAGAGGGIYITEDGGTTWAKQASASFTGDDAFANVVYFWNKDEGFCMGDPNGGYFEIYTTSDGGSNWTRVAQANIPANQSQEYGTVGLYCVDEDGVAYFNTTKGRIFKSTDKGANWTVISTPLSGRTRIAFADENIGVVMEAGNNSNAYYTTDGGANWTKIDDPDLYGSNIHYVKGTDRMFVSSSADANKGAGASYSIDGGKTWTVFTGLDDTQCLAIGFSDMTTGWLGQFSANSTSGGMLKYNGEATLAGFSVNPLAPERDATVTFTDMTLSQEGSLNYSWDFGADATPATANTEGPHDVVYSTIGTKTVSLTVNGQLVKQDIEVATPTSVESKFASYDFSIYPNPNNGQFKMKINSERSSEVFMEVYGTNGQIVYFNRFNKAVGQAEFSVDMGSVNRGVYVMKVFDGKSYQVKKIVVK